MRLIAVALLLLFWAISLDSLAIAPVVEQDEPWVAAAPVKLATEGVLGSDLFTGYYGMERHHYHHPPLYPLLQAGVFRFIGIGVWQMRVLPVALGLLTMALTYAVGKQLADERTGVVAMLLLLCLRLAAGGPNTGIPLLDLARVNRYDIAVPVFGLAALWTFNRAARRGRLGGVFLSGMLVGLAGLSHVYGLFWAPVLAVAAWWQARPQLKLWQAWAALAAGLFLVWTPWLIWVVSGWSDFIGQQRLIGDRFDVLDPGFYLDNLRRELERYRPLQLTTGMRPGAWLALLALPVAVALLARSGLRSSQRGPLTLAAALVVPVGLFALLLKQKHFNYLIALWPLAVLALAWLAVRLWDRDRRPLVRAAMLVALSAILVEGGSRIVDRHQSVAHTTSYDQFEARVASLIPQGSRVLGLQHYWLGLRSYPYRTWLLPLVLSGPSSYEHPMPFDQAIEFVDPDVILIDRYMRAYFEEAAAETSPYHASAAGFQAFMQRHGARLAGTVDDSTYGLMEVYWLN